MPLHSNNFKHNLWYFQIPEDLATNTPNLLHVGLSISLDVIEITLGYYQNMPTPDTRSRPRTREVLANGDPFASANTSCDVQISGLGTPVIMVPKAGENPPGHVKPRDVFASHKSIKFHILTKLPRGISC